MHRNRMKSYVQRRHGRSSYLAISFVIWTGHSAWLDSQFNYRESSRAAIDGAMQTSPIAPLQNKQVDIVCRSVRVEREREREGCIPPLVNQMRTKLKNCSTHCLISLWNIYFPPPRFCVSNFGKFLLINMEEQRWNWLDKFGKVVFSFFFNYCFNLYIVPHFFELSPLPLE